MHYSGRWCGHAYAVGRRTRLHFWCAYARGACGPNGSGHAYAVGRRTRLHFWCAYACQPPPDKNPRKKLFAREKNFLRLQRSQRAWLLMHVVLVCICMWLQRSQPFGVHMHVAPTAPTVLAAYACGSNGFFCAGSAGMHMPCLRAYARG